MYKFSLAYFKWKKSVYIFIDFYVLFINNDYSQGEHVIPVKFVQSRRSTIILQQLKKVQM